MGTRTILVAGLADLPGLGDSAPLRLLELGAGDGTLMLGVAQTLARSGLRAELTLLDRQRCLEQVTVDAYARLGWTVAMRVEDVNDWVARTRAERWDAIVVNLFLHHFTAAQVAAMLAAIAHRTARFFACEPRRGWFALAASHLVGAIGANAVTRRDAVLSVRAGFTDHELSALWPGPRDAWHLREYPARLFSHCLHATRRATA
jgi:2-polyprenyl-3-methyl-5-hydroxy-6-metoxy-1,4-benzoquinol methylase